MLYEVITASPLTEKGPKRFRDLHPDQGAGLVPDVPETLLKPPGHVDVLGRHRRVEQPDIEERLFPKCDDDPGDGLDPSPHALGSSQKAHSYNFV